jgi:hypothetical protein
MDLSSGRVLFLRAVFLGLFAALSQFADYNSLTENIASLSGIDIVELTDGSAKYGQPVCPESSNCGAILFRDEYYSRGRSVTCPIGTEMELSLVGPTGTQRYLYVPESGVELSGPLPAIYNLVSGQYSCDGGPSTLRFVQASVPCQPVEAVAYGFPQTVLA